VADEIQNRLCGINSFIPLSSNEELWVEKILKIIERKKEHALITTHQQQASSSTATSHTLPSQELSTLKEPQDRLIRIDPMKITHHHTTELGPELVILQGWNALGMDALLKSLGFKDRHVGLALLSVANRLIDPCAEHALPSWIETTSFPDLCKHIPKNPIDEQFYRVSDLLWDCKDSIEKVLADKERSLFDLERTLYLYDTSNTYFEGALADNPKAQRSAKSKEMRSDAKQLAFGLILDDKGFVIRHETFPGNMHDSPTLQKMIDALGENVDFAGKPLIVMDSGFSSDSNLKMLRDTGYDYIVTGRRPTRLLYENDFCMANFKEIANREGKEPITIAFKDEDNERIVFCHSDARGEKEKAILSKAEERLLKDLKRLAARLEQGSRSQLKTENAASQALGRLKERHPRIARYYELRIEVKRESEPSEVNVTEKIEQPTSKRKVGRPKKTSAPEEEKIMKLHFQRLDEEYLKAERLCGSYYMRCSRKDLDDDTIWKLYMMLTQVEASFRTLKTDLGLRPIFHHKEHRCDSHIFITVLAYRILHWIEYVLRQNGDTRRWSTIRRILQTHCYTTIVCPSDNEVHRIRVAGEPEVMHKQIYNTLGVDWKNLPRQYIITKLTGNNFGDHHVVPFM
jgi:transposase